MLPQVHSIPIGIDSVKPPLPISDTQRDWIGCNALRVMSLRSIERYRLLVHQLLADHGDDQREVARILGIKQPSVSRLKDGKRKAGIDAVELAVRRLKLAPQFFFAPTPVEPHYRDFQGLRKIPPKMGYPALWKFFKMAEEGGMLLTQHERAILTQQEWDGDPVPETYMLMLQAIRSVEVPEDTVVRLRKTPSKIVRKEGAS
jgi:predicted XRE-type DNA-binding protein